MQEQIQFETTKVILKYFIFYSSPVLTSFFFGKIYDRCMTMYHFNHMISSDCFNDSDNMTLILSDI